MTLVKTWWKKVLIFWFRHQSAIFLILLIGIAGIGIFLWYTYFYAFGRDSARIETILEQKESFEFQEEKYQSIREELEKRTEDQEKEIEAPRELFVPIPEGLREEE